MVTVPAFVWRGGFFRRALLIGGFLGIVLGAMAWIDSGLLLAGILAALSTGLIYGIWMPRRMARYWPGAKQLSGEDRVTVARTARHGEPIGDPQLAPAVIDYSNGMQASAEQAKPYRWVVPLILIVSIATALWDSIFGTWGNAIVSLIYLVALLLELLWWPKRRGRLLANGDRAADIACDILEKRGADQKDP